MTRTKVSCYKSTVHDKYPSQGKKISGLDIYFVDYNPIQFWCVFCNRFTKSIIWRASHTITIYLLSQVVILSSFIYLGYIDVDQWVNWVLQLPEDEITKLTKFTILPAEMGAQTPHSR